MLSVSGTGFIPQGATTLTDTWNSQTASTSAIGTTVTATSASTTVDATAGTLGTSQSVSAAWTGALTGTATFADTWTTSGVTGASGLNADLNFGLGAPVGNASAVFTFTLGSAGSYDVNWSASTGGDGTFGLLNMAISVDGGPLIYSPTQLAAVVSPTGDYVGNLTAGTHTISVYDPSNVSGFPATGTGSLNETLGLTITPSTSSVIGVNGVALSSMTFTAALTAPGQTLTSQAGGLDLFQGTAAAINGDTFANLMTNDIIDVTDMAFSGLGISVTSSGGNTVVTLAENSTTNGSIQVNGQSTSFTVAGTFTQSSFHVASDGNNGVLIAHS